MAALSLPIIKMEPRQAFYIDILCDILFCIGKALFDACQLLLDPSFFHFVLLVHYSHPCQWAAIEWFSDKAVLKHQAFSPESTASQATAHQLIRNAPAC